jgi:hypothetical protein
MVHDLAIHFGARIVVVFDERGPYPGALDAAASCFTRIPLPGASARAYRVAEDECPP